LPSPGNKKQKTFVVFGKGRHILSIMRPLNPAQNGKANGKAAKKAGGVRKSLVKAKVSAVKTTRRLGSRGHLKSEVDNLLEHSVVASPAAKPAKQAKKSPKKSPRKNIVAANGNANGVAGLKKTMSAANLKKQLKKLQGSNGAASPSVESPRRSSRKTRASAVTPAYNKKDLNPLDLSVEMADEATEETTSNGADAVDGAGGFGLLRSISSKFLPGVRYNQFGENGQADAKAKQEEADAKAKAKEAEANAEGKSSCVIS